MVLYLKLWYSFYIRVEYRRLHENNLARRAQLMCAAPPPPANRATWIESRASLEHLLDTVAQDYENNNGGGKGWEGRGGGGGENSQNAPAS